MHSDLWLTTAAVVLVVVVIAAAAAAAIPPPPAPLLSEEINRNGKVKVKVSPTTGRRDGPRGSG